VRCAHSATSRLRVGLPGERYVDRVGKARREGRVTWQRPVLELLTTSSVPTSVGLASPAHGPEAVTCARSLWLQDRKNVAPAFSEQEVPHGPLAQPAWRASATMTHAFHFHRRRRSGTSFRPAV